MIDKEIRKLLIATLISGLLFGLAIGYVTGSLNQPRDFSEQQKEFILNVGYSAGFCERLGLQSYLIINTTEEGQEYGVPICAEKSNGDING
jgi:ABC-type uncharacterized transport system permease subunit